MKCTTYQNLKNTTVDLGSGFAMKTKEDWKWSGAEDTGLFTFDNCTKVVISGGTIDASGQIWWPAEGEDRVDRPSLIVIKNCREIEVKNLTLINSPFYNFRLYDSTDIVIHDIKFISPPDSPNTDGVNVEQGVNRLEVYNCDVQVGDDAFAVNAFKGPSSNCTFRDSIIRSGHGVSIGSGVYNKITNIKFNNIKFIGTRYIGRVKCKKPPSAYPRNKGVVEDVTFSNLSGENIERLPIMVDAEYGDEPNTEVKCNNIIFNDIVCKGSKLSYYLVTPKKNQVEVKLKNITITGVESTNPTVKNVTPKISNVTVKKR